MTASSINFDKLSQQLSDPRVKSGFRTLLLVILSIYVIITLVQLLWAIIPEPAAPRTASLLQSTTTIVVQQSDKKNLQILLGLNVFGSPEQEQAAPIQQDIADAPETTLNLTLHGVVATSIERDGAAIISRSNIQQTYGIGDRIDGTQASLSEVFPDRVIISNRGVKETLMLDGIDYSKLEQDNLPPQPISPEAPGNDSDSVVVQLDADVVSNLRAQPQSFSEFIAISPVRNAGEITGYEVKPGKNKALFERVGLKPGDVITMINGFDLTNARESLRAMQLLQTEAVIDLELLRNGQNQSISIELP